MNKLFTILAFFIFVNFTQLLAQKNELNTTILKSTTIIDSIDYEEPKLSIEFENGTSKRGRLIQVDEINKKVIIGNASDSTEIDFKKVYNVHKGDFNGSTGMLYQIDAPERFFYTPMGNTMKKGMFAIENYFFLNLQLKAAPIDGLELGLGLTLWPNQEVEDTSISTYVMASVKYRVLNRRHLKMAIGAETIQMPPSLLFATQQNPIKPPWLNIMYVAANWEYKYMTFSFAASQAYLNTVPVRQYTSLFNSDRGADYMVSASASVKIFPFLHAISENIYFAGAWNNLGSPNNVGKVNLVMPLVGGRYYGEYYSFGGGISNVLIPNAVLFFYVGGSYYFM